MLAVHARYRGRSVRRAELVQRSATALSTLNGVGEFHVLGVEDICDVVMALLADGDWAIGIGISPGNQEDEEGARQVATAALRKSARMGQVYAKLNKRGRASEASDIAATFALLGYVLHKRTIEGREATSLVRAGLNQNEAAEELGISKQAMSQRLQAAGWSAEMAGWQLAVNLIERANLAQP